MRTTFYFDDDKQLVQLARTYIDAGSRITWKDIGRRMRATGHSAAVLRQRLQTLFRTYGRDIARFPANFFTAVRRPRGHPPAIVQQLRCLAAHTPPRRPRQAEEATTPTPRTAAPPAVRQEQASLESRPAELALRLQGQHEDAPHELRAAEPAPEPRAQEEEVQPEPQHGESAPEPRAQEEEAQPEPQHAESAPISCAQQEEAPEPQLAEPELKPRAQQAEVPPEPQPTEPAPKPHVQEEEALPEPAPKPRAQHEVTAPEPLPAEPGPEHQGLQEEALRPPSTPSDDGCVSSTEEKESEANMTEAADSSTLTAIMPVLPLGRAEEAVATMCADVPHSADAQAGDSPHLNVGEVLPSGVTTLLRELGDVGEDDVFFDIVAGLGNIIAQVVLATKVSKAIGIEVRADVYNLGVQMISRSPYGRQIHAKAELYCNDITGLPFSRKPPFEQATIVLWNNILFEPVTTEYVKREMAVMLQVRFVVCTASVCLRHREPCFSEFCTSFELFQEVNIQCSWKAEPQRAYLYRSFDW